MVRLHPLDVQHCGLSFVRESVSNNADSHCKSDSSSRKSSTWKSPSSWTIPHAAGARKSDRFQRSKWPLASSGFDCNLLQSFLVDKHMVGFRRGVFPRFSNHSSNETLTNGAQIRLARMLLEHPMLLRYRMISEQQCR